MKRFLTLILALLMTVFTIIIPSSAKEQAWGISANWEKDYYENSVFPDVPPELTSFDDITVKDWEYNAVYYTEKNGLFYGVGNNHFGGKIDITRGSLVTVLGRLASVDTSLYPGTSFSDVEEGKFYSPYVEWASKNEIVFGYGGGLFGPNDPATRQDVACMLLKFAQYCGADTSGRDDITLFKDYSDISAYAHEALSYGKYIGLFSGAPSAGGYIVMPKKAATRSEMAQLISVFDYGILHEPAETFYTSLAISSDMVLQRNGEIKIWGFSEVKTEEDDDGNITKTALDAGKTVIVEFLGSRGVAFVKEDGSWTATLSRRFPVNANLGNTLRVYSGKGEKEIVFNNILVGDVFMNFGQSNMWVTCDKVMTDSARDAGLDYTGFFDDSDDQLVRLFRLTMADVDIGVGWSRDCVTVTDDIEAVVPSDIYWKMPSEGYLTFSALGYVFATNLYKTTGIPVGMVQVDASGNPLSAFCPKEVTSKYGMERHPRTDPEIAAIIDQQEHDPENFSENFYVDTYDYSSGSASRWVFNRLIHPLLNLNCSGMLWYQGESDQYNTTYFNGSEHAHYAEEFGAFMNYLREHFNNETFPVVFCEYVSCYRYKKNGQSNGYFMPFGVARSENSLIEQYLSDSYVSPSADMWYDTEFNENIHPYCKPFQAFRVLDIMLARVFGVGDLDSAAGTTLASVEYDGNSALLTFNHSSGFRAGAYDEEKETIVSSDAPLYGIEVMPGTDRQTWVKASSIEVVAPNQIKITYSGTIYGVRYNADDSLFFGMSGRSNICDSGLLPIVAFADYGTGR